MLNGCVFFFGDRRRNIDCAAVATLRLSFRIARELFEPQRQGDTKSHKAFMLLFTAFLGLILSHGAKEESSI
jgi:hypothetical protein